MERATHIIVLGNEKGGSGKSTTAMHLFVALARAGHRVGAIDLDTRQKSFFRYLDNRAAHGQRVGARLLMPERVDLSPSEDNDRLAAAEQDRVNLGEAIAHLAARCRFIVIDTPGSATPLSAAAHMHADTLITPINDSLIDFDMLGRIDPISGKVAGPSVYAEMVWSARQKRAAARKPPIDWVVLRNRMSMLESKNKRKVGTLLSDLARRIGFRIIPGFGERVIFRELFHNGLTLLDLKKGGAITLTLSHVAARQEIREMVHSLDLPGITAEI